MAIKHGMHGTPEYNAWRSMHQRCRDPKCRSFAHYGARGIRVAPEFKQFSAFFAEIGLKPSPAHSLDRKNNDGHYAPGNIRWATAHEQMRNRSDNYRLRLGDTTKTLAEWSQSSGISVSTLWARLRTGHWPTEQALTQNVKRRRKYDDPLIEHDGQSKTLAEWSRTTGISLPTLWARLRKLHWPVERVLTESIQSYQVAGRLGAARRWKR